MTNQRWKVRKIDGFLGGWVVDGPNMRLRTFESARIYSTWREAMEYADRMSRTIEATLPSKPGQIRIGRRTHVMVTQAKNGGTALYILDDSGKDQIIFMKAKYLKPFALALLAHHHKNQDTP